jgi:feruloyl esterase
MYPQIVFQRDLGSVPLTRAQQDLVSNAAIATCDGVRGEHLGYVLDPSTCACDPTKDPDVLCAADGGTNTTPACVSKVQAAAMNTIWYGMKADGSAPDPAVDNGWSAAAVPRVPGGTYRWFDLTRGTSLYGAAFVPLGVPGVTEPGGPFPIASDYLALQLEDPSIAGPGFVNATGNGQSRWKTLSYAQLSEAFDRGLALQPAFDHINTDDPDLTAFRDAGGKLLTWHGLADELIMPQGTVNDYHRVIARMGGVAEVQDFYRLYRVPGLGHGTPNGTSNPDATPPNFTPTQLYELLIDWVEHGRAPESIVLHSGAGDTARSMPVCVYPEKITYRGGDPKVAGSHTCS